MPDSSHQEPSYKDLTGRVRRISDLYFAYGGFSEVFKGVYVDDTGSQRDVAIKIIRGIHISSDIEATITRRLNREAKVWHTLKHPHVLEFLGIARNLGQSVALVSPYCENGNISKYLDDYPEANRLNLLLGVAKGVEYLHSKDVIHGDIKGRNVLVNDDGSAIMCDFGRSKIINHRGFTTLFAGVARYMAPELIVKGVDLPESDDGSDDNFDPSQFLSKESDVYAFSMVGVEILTTEPPYPKITNENKIILKVPDGLRPSKADYRLSGQHQKIWEILEKCWVAEPSKRLTMSTVAERLSLI
ncbi:hypothetical protein AX17_007271 [Amanita inopinata Kibby_2008]|nr:hypothetical protein AX17_007271 [Amanita inopinata Kibby_2008]